MLRVWPFSFSLLLPLMLALFVAGCAERDVPAPNDREVTQALHHHYQQVIKDAPIIRLQYPERRLSGPEATSPVQAGAGSISTEAEPVPDGDPDSRADPSSLEEDCQDVRIIIGGDGKGREKREVFRLSCDSIHEAKISMREGIKSLGEMVNAFTQVIEREFSHITGLAHASVLACVPAYEYPGFMCDVNVAFTYSDNQLRERFVSARFVKGPDGWVALDVKDGTE